MADSAGKLVDQIAQLNAARNLVLGDAAFYPQIVEGILPIVGAHARLELRRWGAEFLAETFASPALAAAQKEKMADKVLQAIREILELPENDTAILKSLVETAASLYPLVFRHIINHPQDSGLWEKMIAIKQDILRRWDSFQCPVKICCIKFGQRIVQVQTPGLIADPRRPEQNETSLSIVPRNHSILSLPNLEAEASGLLDRLLTVLQDTPSDPLLVNATLNCLAVLVRTRSSIANKIIAAILEFHPMKQMVSPLTPTQRVCIKSMERTVKAVLVNIMKRVPGHPFTGKIQHYIDRLQQARLEVLDDTSRKRGLPAEPVDGLDNAKRARLDAQTPPLLKIPPLPSGPISYAQLYTLTEDVGLSSFDVKQLPSDLVVKIAVPILARIDASLFNQAIGAIRSRYQTLSKQQAAEAQRQQQEQPPAEEEDDDYEPEYQPMDIADTVSGQTDAVATEVADTQPELVSLGPFVLPQPPPLSEEEATEVGKSAVARVFGTLVSTESPAQLAKARSQQRLGFSRLAGSSGDKDAWVVLLTRLATRASANLDVEDGQMKTDRGILEKQNISDSIRDLLYRYILEDFRSRLNVGITWLNEEWYNGRIQLKFTATHRSDDDSESTVPLHYDRWVLRLLDGILPYLDSRDTKILIRFLSEIPDLTVPIAQRIASLARDPERVNLCVQTLLYLIMFRPPARELCLNTLEDVYQTYEESRPAAGKILSRWRPRKEEQQQAQKQTAGPPSVSLEVRTSSSNESAMNGFQARDSSRAGVEEAHTGKDEAATQHGQIKEQGQETEQLESSSA
ncbi:hypothetical protein MPDQ_001051, partial [Monascus purpureus]